VVRGKATSIGPLLLYPCARRHASAARDVHGGLTPGKCCASHAFGPTSRRRHRHRQHSMPLPQHRRMPSERSDLRFRTNEITCRPNVGCDSVLLLRCHRPCFDDGNTTSLPPSESIAICVPRTVPCVVRSEPEREVIEIRAAAHVLEVSRCEASAAEVLCLDRPRWERSGATDVGPLAPLRSQREWHLAAAKCFHGTLCAWAEISARCSAAPAAPTALRACEGRR
jgi:hypothetical protein